MIDAIVIREKYPSRQLEVLEAPTVAAISVDLYEQIASGRRRHPDCKAGEGWLVIRARNGLFRYRLTGERIDQGRTHLAIRHAAPNAGS